VFQIFNNNDNTNIITVSQVAKLTAETGDSMEFFGWTVAIHGNAILVSALGVDNISGSVYFFGNPSNDPNTPEWTQFQQIQPNDLTENDWFGFSMAMDGNLVVVGTGSELADANAAYVFVMENIDSSSSSWSSAWTQTVKLTGLTDSRFGVSVAVA
jgi:hypothetical protein